MARSAAFTLALVTLLLAGTARADQSLHATGTVTTGFTNNILGLPNSDRTLVQSDAFASIAPGALFSYESQKFRVTARYTIAARLFLRQSGANSFSNFLNIRGSTDLSPKSDIELAVSGSAGRINAFDAAPADAEIGLEPNGDIAYARTNASGVYTRQLSWEWRFRQLVEGSAFTPTDETTSINTNWNFGSSMVFERTYKRHQVTGSFEGRYVHNERIDEDSGLRIDPDLQVILGPRIRWLWDISGRLSSALSLGVVRVFAPDDIETGLLQPQATAQVNYLKERSTISLRFGHGVTTNSLVGQTSTTDRVELRGYYPTTEILEDSGLTGTIGYQHAQFIDVQSESLAASSDQGAIDIAATWRQYEGLSWALRYQFSKRTRGIAVLGSSEDTSRHQVQIGLTVRYPDRQAVELPERSGDRVDGANEQDEIEREQNRR